MSMFIVNETSIVNIYSFIKATNNRIVRIDLNDKELKEALQVLYNINVEVWNTKYNQKTAITVIKFKESMPVNIYQFLKHLHCLDYQIEEEYVKMTDKKKEALELLNLLIMQTTSSIIRKLPEYVKAEYE
jgi:hypothetical protein